MTTAKALERTIGAVLKGARRATQYLAHNYIVKATGQHKPNRRSRSQTIIVTVGDPNYAEREFVKRCKKTGEPFPVKKMQLRHWNTIGV